MRALVLALALLVVPALASARANPLVIGERAPAIELGDQHGKPFRLADALGANRFVVVAFYVKAFTGG